MSRLKVAFLYSEMAGYVLANIKELAKEADVLIFRWPVASEAPFLFENIEGVEMIDRSLLEHAALKQKLSSFNPDLIVCSGWMDKGYLKLVRSFRKKIPTLVSLDNHWRGDAKQRLAAAISPFTLKRIFTHAWVPGTPQKRFARKLGFKDRCILEDFYVADVPLFKDAYKKSFQKKKEAFPKRILYVGRYVEHKGIFELWEAFKELKQDQSFEWELWCIGTGDEWDNRIESEGIQHHGFVQANEMGNYLDQTSIYILPSKFEPWGVTIQEFAICGFPIIASKHVGAATKYVSEENGLIIEEVSKEALKNALLQLTSESESKLLAMGEKSHKIGVSVDNSHWVENLKKVVS